MAESVRVIVRCRPMNQREKSLSCKSVLNIDNRIGQCAISNPNEAMAAPKLFTFDGAYDENSVTEQMYAEIGYPLVEGVTEGYNGTIFAYGQTGSGKSFTMQGITDPPAQRGIIPRAFDHVFETVQVSEGVKYLIHASYLEIYNEDIRDLLGSDTKQKLELKERPDSGVYVQGLSMHPCKNVRDCERVMERGWSHRATGATLMNADSSRSHSIFTIHLERCDTDTQGEGHIRAAKLNLVDLAGSERQSKTGATGDRLKEATKINLSLSALGNVISALVDGKSTHIPYRDSKLTRLLQDSLGGNTKTLMVACLSPADNNYDETLSTLRYANRAKNIKNKPKINEDPKDALLREYQDEIKRLKDMLQGNTSLSDRQQQHSEPKIVEKIVHLSNEEEIEQAKKNLREEFEQQMREMKSQFEEMRLSKERLQEEMGRLRGHYEQQVASVVSQGNNTARGHHHSNEEEDEETEERDDRTAGDYYDDGTFVAADAPRTDKHNGKAKQSSATKKLDNRHSKKAQPTAEYNADAGRLSLSSYEDGLADDKSAARMGGEGEGFSREAGVSADALKRRLMELQQQMVGGEQANNEEVKRLHQKKKVFAEERKRKLQLALAERDGDDIMVDVYESIHDELRAKKRALEREKEKTDSLQQDIKDLSKEFEQQKVDYLETIRKQDQQLKWLQSVVEKIHPCLRRDCNYVNIDRVRAQSVWDEDKQCWVLPKLTIEQTRLPTSSKPNGRQLETYQQEEEEYSEYSDRDMRRQSNVVGTDAAAAEMHFRRRRSSKLSDLQQQQEATQAVRVEMRAAQVHGLVSNDEPQAQRRPFRLNSIQGPPPTAGSRKRSTDYY